MKFSVIYEADIPMRCRVSDVAPPRCRAWFLTEQSDGKPSDWCGELWDGKVKHRKWCAVLTRKQFDRFVVHVGLFAEDVETMGSLGAPGCGFGLSPAISFRNDDTDAIQSAYVTPLIEVEAKREITPERSDKVWNRVRRAMLRTFGS